MQFLYARIQQKVNRYANTANENRYMVVNVEKVIEKLDIFLDRNKVLITKLLNFKSYNYIFLMYV